MNRILAIALALVIGSPGCWCCVSARAASDAAPAPASCCVPAAGTSHGCPIKQDGGRAPGTGKSCACDSAKAAREGTDGGVIVPVASAHFNTVSPQVFALPCGPPSSFVRDAVMAHGPPCHKGSIFARDCALRL